MKFNVSVEIDWINESGNLDDEVKHQIISGLSKKLEQEFSGEAGRKMSLAAEKLLTAKTEYLINAVLEKPVVIKEAFGRSEEFDSIMDMVEQKMTNLYMGKLNINGQCTKDPLLANIDESVKRQVSALLQDVTRKVETHSKISAQKAVKENALVQSLQKVLNYE